MFSFFGETTRKKPAQSSYLGVSTSNITALCLTAFWTPISAGSWCFMQYNVPYYLSCQSSTVLKLINFIKDCENVSSYFPCGMYSGSQGFGSNFYHTENICTLNYPDEYVPNPCIVDVLTNNTPDKFTESDLGITSGLVLSSLLSAGIFTCYAIKKWNEKIQYQALDSGLNSGAEMTQP